MNKNKKKITCTVFLYDEMDVDNDEFTWDNFCNSLNQEIDKSKKYIDHMWDSLYT
ncbi:hypothetical protein C1646_750642 [Rhizophagus diaphanus]|nr:hypothetical protein C1646_750642 [Rhizophagus diaphanus] [Rhizophagus sp. MUCL 43196]